MKAGRKTGRVPSAADFGSSFILHPSSFLMSHTIRLRGFWTATPADGGRTRHARAFGRPGTLGPAERVWLVGPALPGAGGVFVNGTPVGTVPGAGGAWAFDVTALLLPRNEVAVVVDTADPMADVALEIRTDG